ESDPPCSITNRHIAEALRITSLLIICSKTVQLYSSLLEIWSNQELLLIAIHNGKDTLTDNWVIPPKENIYLSVIFRVTFLSWYWVQNHWVRSFFACCHWRRIPLQLC